MNKILLNSLLIFNLSLTIAAENKIEAAYVVYGQDSNLNPMPMARVVIAGLNQACPQLNSDLIKINMTIRINPNSTNFPITVCEAKYPFATIMRVGNSEVMLPKVNKNIEKVTVFGDTGCKSSHQDCDLDSDNWPFPSLVSKAAQGKFNADVVLHMGDYNYSGTPGNIKIKGMNQSVQVYDAGDNTNQGLCKIPGAYYGQNSIGSMSPDSWKHWKSDFFSAAKPLFSQVPWVFARGNHELCSRAGPGWFYLLDPNSSLLGQYNAQLSCPAANNPTPQILSAPYILQFPTLNLAMVDSTNACDYGLLNSENYINQFSILKNLIKTAASDDKPTWIQTHRPIWGVDKLDSGGSCGKNKSNKYCIVNKTMQNAMKQYRLPKAVNLIVSGHMHRFQLVDFKSDKHPDQLVVGNGGVKLSGLHPKTSKQIEIGKYKAAVLGIKQFGYMNIKLKPNDQWQGQLLNPNLSPSVLLNCDSLNYPMCEKPDTTD